MRELLPLDEVHVGLRDVLLDDGGVDPDQVPG